MAKKSVATLQTGSKRLTKAIKMIKKEGSESYSFVEKIIDPSFVKDWIANKPLKQVVIPSKPIERIEVNSVKSIESKENIKKDEPQENIIESNVLTKEDESSKKNDIADVSRKGS